MSAMWRDNPEEYGQADRRSKRALVTGCAGFLGSHLSERLVTEGYEVVGVDCFTPYYARAIKEANIEALLDEPCFTLHEVDLAADALDALLEGVAEVYHLAGQPGVRASFGSAFADYLRLNAHATERLLEACASRPLETFVYASSSAVYGDATSYPTREDVELRPLSPYAVTKIATEKLAGMYFRQCGVPVIGLRYFTAYGPRQRPDMAFARFVSRALAGESLTLFGDGLQKRAFTYVMDAIAGTQAAARRGKRGEVYNIGNSVPVSLTEVVHVLEDLLGRPVPVEHVSAAPGEARRTQGDGSRAEVELDFVPQTPLAEGLAAQLEWILADVPRRLVAA